MEENENNKTVLKTVLKKDLDLKDLVLLGIGNIVGAGIFIILSKIIKYGGNKTIYGIIIVSIISIIMAFCYLEINQRYKSNIGEYLAIKENMGKYIGNISLYIIYLFAILSVVTIVVSLSKYILKFDGVYKIIKDTKKNQMIMSVAFLLVMSIINYLGIDASKMVTNSIGVILLIVLVAIILLCIPQFNIKNISNGNTISYNSFALSTILALFLFNGYDIFVKMHDEVKNEGDIKNGIILSISITTIIYILIILLAISVLGYSKISKSYHIITNLYEATTNPFITFISYIIGFIIMFNTAFITFLGSTRFLYGCGKDDNVHFSKKLSELNKNQAPYYSILLSLIACIIFALFNNEVLIAIFTNFSCILLLLLIGISIIIVRWKNKDNIEDQEKNNHIYGNINNIPIVVVLAIISLFYIFYKIIINNFYIKELYEYDK
jgi:basic amino acid/polyamine antiporter, APA family